MSRCVLNAGTAAPSLAETLTVARRRWPLKVPVAFVEPCHSHQSGSLQVTAASKPLQSPVMVR